MTTSGGRVRTTIPRTTATRTSGRWPQGPIKMHLRCRCYRLKVAVPPMDAPGSGRLGLCRACVPSEVHRAGSSPMKVQVHGGPIDRLSQHRVTAMESCRACAASLPSGTIYSREPRRHAGDTWIGCSLSVGGGRCPEFQVLARAPRNTKGRISRSSRKLASVHDVMWRFIASWRHVRVVCALCRGHRKRARRIRKATIDPLSHKCRQTGSHKTGLVRRAEAGKLADGLRSQPSRRIRPRPATQQRM